MGFHPDYRSVEGGYLEMRGLLALVCVLLGWYRLGCCPSFRPQDLPEPQETFTTARKQNRTQPGLVTSLRNGVVAGHS
jgi:hypothetical protein